VQHELEEFCKIITQLPQDLNIDKVSSINDALFLYSTHSYDIVLIDYISKEDKNLIQNILNIDAKQFIYILSNKLECIEKNGCNYCCKYHNVSRILKPIKQKDIIKIINKDISCKKYCNDILQMKLYIIEKQIDYSHNYYLDIKNFIFKKNQNISGTETTFLQIISKLKEFNILFEVDENYDIQIISNQ
jgi:hypothetical protein